MFENKRRYQKDQIIKWKNNKRPITKMDFAKKINVSRVTLDKLLHEVNNKTLWNTKGVIQITNSVMKLEGKCTMELLIL